MVRPLLIPNQSEQPFRVLLIKTINEVSLWQQTIWLVYDWQTKELAASESKQKLTVRNNYKFNSLKFPQKFN